MILNKLHRLRLISLLILSVLLGQALLAQEVYESTDYSRIYDFLDELSNDRVIDLNSAIKPYTRAQIAGALKQATAADSLLSSRQQKDLAFFCSEFALELDTLPKAYVHWTNHRTFDLSLVQPQFLYSDRWFKCQIRPLLGMHLIGNYKGLIIKRWYGADLQMDIVKHLSVWGSLRDQSYNGNFLNKTYFPQLTNRMYGARLSQAGFLNTLPGCAYKEANYGGDYSDFRGGIRAYDWWGSIGLVKDNVQWGDNYHGSNILSGRAPSFPMLTLQLKPCKWFEFNYFHAWLVSSVVDSSYYYTEETYNIGESKTHYRPMNKFMAANMFTFTPIKGLKLSVGNSIIYAERNVQAIYFIPFAFFKSLDHLLTKDLRVENQNSQLFFNISSRNVRHLHLYASVFIDEFSFSRWKKDNAERNPVSYKLGARVSDWPLKNLSVGFEYTRNQILSYKHSIEAINYNSNSYQLGHYLGDNAQEFYVNLCYKPIRSLQLDLSYTKAQKGNDYLYVRRLTKEALSQQVLKDVVYESDELLFKALYEVWPNAYAVLNVGWNYNRANEATGQAAESENRQTAAETLNRYSPLFYQGAAWTATIGFSIGF